MSADSPIDLVSDDEDVASGQARSQTMDASLIHAGARSENIGSRTHASVEAGNEASQWVRSDKRNDSRVVVALSPPHGSNGEVSAQTGITRRMFGLLHRTTRLLTQSYREEGLANGRDANPSKTDKRSTESSRTTALTEPEQNEHAQNYPSSMGNTEENSPVLSRATPQQPVGEGARDENTAVSTRAESLPVHLDLSDNPENLALIPPTDTEHTFARANDMANELQPATGPRSRTERRKPRWTREQKVERKLARTFQTPVDLSDTPRNLAMILPTDHVLAQTNEMADNWRSALDARLRTERRQNRWTRKQEAERRSAGLSKTSTSTGPDVEIIKGGHAKFSFWKEKAAKDLDIAPQMQLVSAAVAMFDRKQIQTVVPDRYLRTSGFPRQRRSTFAFPGTVETLLQAPVTAVENAYREHTAEKLDVSRIVFWTDGSGQKRSRGFAVTWRRSTALGWGRWEAIGFQGMTYDP